VLTTSGTFPWSFVKFVIHVSINEEVPINVLQKQTRRVWKYIFVIYLESINKQSRTESFFLVTKSCAQVNNFGVYLFQIGHLPRS
jgi:hypothetical protein